MLTIETADELIQELGETCLPYINQSWSNAIKMQLRTALMQVLYKYRVESSIILDWDPVAQGAEVRFPELEEQVAALYTHRLHACT